MDSDEEEKPEALAFHKKRLLEWVVEADFSKDLSLAEIAKDRFKLDPTETSQIHGQDEVLKICKVLMYKIGLTYKR